MPCRLGGTALVGQAIAGPTFWSCHCRTNVLARALPDQRVGHQQVFVLLRRSCVPFKSFTQYERLWYETPSSSAGTESILFITLFLLAMSSTCPQYALGCRDPNCSPMCVCLSICVCVRMYTCVRVRARVCVCVCPTVVLCTGNGYVGVSLDDPGIWLLRNQTFDQYLPFAFLVSVTVNGQDLTPGATVIDFREGVAHRIYAPLHGQVGTT